MRNDARAAVWRGQGPGRERGEEELVEVKVSDDIRAPLEIVTVYGERVEWGPHYTPALARTRQS